MPPCSNSLSSALSRRDWRICGTKDAAPEATRSNPFHRTPPPMRATSAAPRRPRSAFPSDAPPRHIPQAGQLCRRSSASSSSRRSRRCFRSPPLHWQGAPSRKTLPAASFYLSRLIPLSTSSSPCPRWHYPVGPLGDFPCGACVGGRPGVQLYGLEPHRGIIKCPKTRAENAAAAAARNSSSTAKSFILRSCAATRPGDTALPHLRHAQGTLSRLRFSGDGIKMGLFPRTAPS